MEQIIKTTFLIAIIDSIFLGIFQRKQIDSYFARINCGQTMNIKWWAAAIVWILLGLSLELYVYPYAKTKRSAVMSAFVFGLITYGLYDFTNLATLANWTLGFTLMDVLWGGVLMAIVTVVRFAA